MALSLSPHQLKPVTHTLPLSTDLLQPYSAPRQLTGTTALHDRPDFETLSIGQTKSPLLITSNLRPVTQHVNDKLASSSQTPPELASWAPLEALGEDEGPSSEVDEQTIGFENATKSAIKRSRASPSPSNDVAAITENTAATKPILKTSISAKPSKRKVARFDGIVITTKPPPYKKHDFSQRIPLFSSASNTQGTSLVDALARTFDANRHTEDTFLERSRTGPHQREASTALQTDAETTDAEDEQLQLNSRLAHSPLKRPFPRTRRIAISVDTSEIYPEDTTPVFQGIPLLGRPVKRLRPIQYDAHLASIDSALGTVQAPISWDAELDFITRDEDFVITPAQAAPPASASVAIDDSLGKASVSFPAQAGNAPRTLTRGDANRAVLVPYQSRGAQFRRRLDAIFGANTVVRTDRGARARVVEYDFFAPLHEVDRVSSPDTSGSTGSVSVASAAESAGGVPSTRITTQSPDMPSTDHDISVDQPFGNQPDETGAGAEPLYDPGEEQMSGWITVLQRLVKGKVHITEEDLERLSIILAEIESVKDGLDSVLTTPELRESIRQLSELHEIPFGDRNKLRQRAENIFRTWPSMVVPETP